VLASKRRGLVISIFDAGRWRTRSRSGSRFVGGPSARLGSRGRSAARRDPLSGMRPPVRISRVFLGEQSHRRVAALRSGAVQIWRSPSRLLADPGRQTRSSMH
jgi:hypothetical protein